LIKRFAHRGLERFFRAGSKSEIQPAHTDRLRLILGVLNAAAHPRDLALPALRLHQLKGQRDVFWAVSVGGNWRVIFRFEDRDVFDVDYLDYH
jgi:proteic killer suppression protein